ncbi:hypothetical protein V2J09_013057 [Rumex salicifolius]
MSEHPDSLFTITFGQSSRVVKRSGRTLDVGISGSGSVSGSKLSVKDRLGTIVDYALEERSHHMFKRQRVEENQGLHKRGGSNDTTLGYPDLRFKLMQKNLSTQFLDNDPPTNMDLRDKLLSKATLPPADGRRSRSPVATLGKRKIMSEMRDIYDSSLHNMVERRTYDDGREGMREPRGTYSLERQSIRDPRDTFTVERQRMLDPRDSFGVERQGMRDSRDNFSVERQRMQDPRGTYDGVRQSLRDPRDSYDFDRRSWREPRHNYNAERRSMRGPEDMYNVERKSMRGGRDNYDVARRGMREPRDSYDAERRSTRSLRGGYNVERPNIQDPGDTYNVGRRSMQEPRDSYNAGRRSMQEPRDSYNAGRRSMQDPRDSYYAGRRTIREPRDINSIERRSIREPRDSYHFEEQSVQDRRGSYSVGRRSTREPKDTCNTHSIQEPKNRYSVERRSMREPRDSCTVGKQNMLRSRDDYDYRRTDNVSPSSNTGSEVPAYTLDNLRRRSTDTVSEPSISPETDVPAVGRARNSYTSDDRRGRSPETVSGSSMSPESMVEELQRKALIQTYDNSCTANVYRRNEVSSPQRVARSATLTKHPGMNIVTHLPGITTPVTAHFPQSSRAALGIPNHGGQSTIDGFLQSLDLEEYSGHFNDEEVDFTALVEMSDTELKELGIPMSFSTLLQLGTKEKNSTCLVIDSVNGEKDTMVQSTSAIDVFSSLDICNISYSECVLTYLTSVIRGRCLNDFFLLSGSAFFSCNPLL